VSDLTALPEGLPAPEDDGACDHLVGLRVPALDLPATTGGTIDLSKRNAARTVVFCYPRTGRPGEPLPEGWDAIPGARGCTPQSCAFRDLHADFAARGAEVFGLSAQDTAYQREMAERLHLPFPVLSDAGLRFAEALRLPTFQVETMRLIRRLTLVIRAGVVEHALYPVFPPDRSAADALGWLDAHPLTR
jgi:peroxiredoxin